MTPRNVSDPSAYLRKRVEKSDHQKMLEAIDELFPDKNEPRELRVHPNDPKMKPDSFEGFVRFARKQRFPTDQEAIDFAKKMWKESLVHVSTDLIEMADKRMDDMSRGQ